MKFKNCRNCEKRYPGCHDHCETYQSERKEYDALKEKQRMDRLGPDILAARRKETIAQMKKRKVIP